MRSNGWIRITLMRNHDDAITDSFNPTPPRSSAMIAWSPWWRECSLCINSSPKLAHLTKKTALASGLIEATDGQIDALVYELYGPTEEEIRIVKESGKR